MRSASASSARLLMPSDVLAAGLGGGDLEPFARGRSRRCRSDSIRPWRLPCRSRRAAASAGAGERHHPGIAEADRLLLGERPAPRGSRRARRPPRSAGHSRPDRAGGSRARRRRRRRRASRRACGERRGSTSGVSPNSTRTSSKPPAIACARGKHGMRRAEPLRLHEGLGASARISCAPCALPPAPGRSPAPDRRAGRFGCLHDMRDHRQAGDRVQHLRQRAFMRVPSPAARMMDRQDLWLMAWQPYQKGLGIKACLSRWRPCYTNAVEFGEHGRPAEPVIPAAPAPGKSRAASRMRSGRRR